MWIVFSTAAALCAALVIVLSKAGIKNLDPMIVFGIEGCCIVVVTWALIIARQIQSELFTIDRKVWGIIIAAGVLTAFSSILSFESLKIGHASRTASYEKIGLVFSVILSILFLKDKFNWRLGIGVLFMVAGALFIAFSDTSKS